MSEKLKETPEQTQPCPQNKQKYSTPTLVEYGDIRELTKSVGTLSKTADGAGGTVNKTA